MSTFKIEPHFRLQEWVAEEKGYFRAEGLDYEFKEFIRASDGAHHRTTVSMSIVIFFQVELLP